MRLVRRFGWLLGLVFLFGWSSGPATAAMCGSTPATTSPGYHCANYCTLACPQKSCSAPCCDWIGNPLEGSTWGHTTCGASPYPCDDCGNGRCGGCESRSGSGNTVACPYDCPPPFKGVTSASPTSNRCVAVTTEFNNLVQAGAEFHIKITASSSGLGDGHYQGVARLNDLDYVALSRSKENAPGQVLLVRMASPGKSGQKWLGRTPSEIGANSFANYDVTELSVDDCKHPGGLSVIGGYLATGAEDCPGSRKVYLWNVANPFSVSGLSFSVNQTPTSDFGRQTSDNRANAATVVKLVDGTYVALAGGKDNNILHFFSGNSLSSGAWTLDYIWEKGDSSTRHGSGWDFPNIQSWQFVVDCWSQDIYLIGTQRASVSIGPFLGSENKAYHYKVTREYRRSGSNEGWVYHLTFMGSKGDFDYERGASNWDAGATPFITDGGDLVIYAVEKCQKGDCPGGFNRMRIVQHWGHNEANCQLTSESCVINLNCCSGDCAGYSCDMLE